MARGDPEALTGHGAGVPFVALPPVGGRRASAPLVVAWHLLDAPRTEVAFAAALPLHGLDAWRVYLGLPMTGSRLPVGGWEELMRLAAHDVVLDVYRPLVDAAVHELGPALVDVRCRLGVDDGAIGVMGGSIGAAVAQLVMAEGDVEVEAAVLVSPVVQLRRVIEAGERRFGTTYTWTDEANAVADRLDFVARADEIARRGQPAVLLVTGGEDDDGFRDPAAQLEGALRHRYGTDARTELVVVPGMAHALADEPGTDPAPPTAHAEVVDRHAIRWFRRHLNGASRGSSE